MEAQTAHKTTDTNLTAQEQSIVSISALTAVGNIDELKKELNLALDAKLTINEIKEELVHLYAYCGFPRSLNAIGIFKNVLDERKTAGIKDLQGKEIVVENNPPNKYEQGRKVLETLTKTPQAKPAPGFGEFAPRVDAFLKEHLFADIFASDVLTFQQRELATISALAAMHGVEPQLQSHIAMGKNTGLTENQLIQVADLIEKHINITQANTLRKLLSKPLIPVLKSEMMVRISEIEVVPEFLEEYKIFAKNIAQISVETEPGVFAIFPMYQKENPAQVRIVEIYSDKNAYQSHIKTAHFQDYKTTTLKMVKSLKLVEMETIDKETMLEIFEKMK